MKVFFAYRDSPERHAALAARSNAIDRYRLFGRDEFEDRGAVVRHNLERRPVSWARAASRGMNAAVYRSGGYGGDFASILSSLRAVNACDVVFSTVDTVGLPLALLKRSRLVRPRLVYTSVGLPERLEQVRPGRVSAFYRDALRRCGAVLAYAAGEADRLREWLGPGGPPVAFVPFGVDTEAFRPVDRAPEVDVLSVGADPRRDFDLLVRVAGRRPEWTFEIVAGGERARALGQLPANVHVESDISLDDVRERLASARVVALPVRDNSYSGATTTLLQAMAMAKPVVVSRTAAIADGYGLEDGINCRLVPPGDETAFERALAETTTGADAARSLGIRARQTVERSLSWERYTNALWELVVSVSSPSGRTPSSR
jgi:glycosyltransferase involved in cell wall biosynthesis